jgi:hypothetical protein
MSAGILRPPTEAGADTSTAVDTAPRRDHNRRIMTAVAIVLAGACAVAFLIPVIGAPVNGDDRYWYLMIGPRAGGSVLAVFRWSWEQIPEEVQAGRLASLGAFERRIVGMAVIEAAVATGTPIVVYQALVKLALFAGGVLSVVAFVRSLRWRSAAGRLVRAGRRTLWLIAIAGTLTVAVGAQAQSQFRNGWTSYAVLTYGAVIFIFGSVALLLWLTRLVAERSKATMFCAVVVLVLLAVATNVSYELVYPAVPVAAVALMVVPVTDQAQRSVGRNAKFVTGTAYLGGFTATFVVIRLYLADICSRTECYEGVQPQLGVGAARTAAYNLLTAIPGSGDNELLADLDRVGWADRYPVMPSAWSVALGLGVIGAVLLSWWASHRYHALDESEPDVAAVERVDRRAEAMMLNVGAGLSLLIGLGTAAIMGISMQAQELVTEPGTPYRNTMVTWTALAFALVLFVRALSLLVPQPAGTVLWVALAALVGTVGALTLPGNMMALRAYRVHPGLSVTESINWEVALGDTTPQSDARRCAVFHQLTQSMSDEWTRSRIYAHANIAFEHYHGQAFCSDSKYPGAKAIDQRRG